MMIVRAYVFGYTVGFPFKTAFFCKTPSDFLNRNYHYVLYTGLLKNHISLPNTKTYQAVNKPNTISFA